MKFYNLLFAFLLVLSLSCVFASDVAYVVKDANRVEANVVSAIEDLGFTYEVIEDIDIPTTDFDEYGMILVWDGTLSNSALLPIGDKRSLVANTYYLDDWGIADYANSQISSGYIYGKVFSEHAVSDGFLLLSLVNLYSQTRIVSYYLPYHLKRAPSLEKIIVTDNSQQNPVIGVIESGGELYDGSYASERIAFFGMVEAGAWSEESKQLFKNTLHWVLSGSDSDGDGVFIDDDCDDSNPLVWQTFSAYLDSDGDGIGAGEMMDVCSGEYLLDGYSYESGDCDDLDFEVWQLFSGYLDSDGDGVGAGEMMDVCSGDSLLDGYVEIDGDCDDSNVEVWQVFSGYVDSDSDGYGAGDLMDVCSGDSLLDGYVEIDGDCDDINVEVWQVFSGYVDSDSDGYGAGDLMDVCSGDSLLDGYVEIDGDCDDMDETYNFDSDDVYKNCVNDAPIIGDYADFVFNESEEVVIDLGVFDPEGDSLVYSIDDARFSETDGVFTWQTGSNDRGSWDFLVTVSDGEFEVFAEVKVQVLNPTVIWSEIGEIEWNEDENMSFDLNDYAFDVDGDDIRFILSETSSDYNIKIESIEEGVVNFSVSENWNGEDWVVFGAYDGGEVVYSDNVTLRVLAVNDIPEFVGVISNETWMEDTLVVDAYDLSSYFSDVDGDELSYGVVGNVSIGVDINQETGLVLLSSVKDWFGTEMVMFYVSDGIDVVYSNLVNLTVIDANEPPVFEELDCELNIYEDEEYDCVLSAVDFEEDYFAFSVLEEENIDCDVDGDELSYVSDEDYFGEGSCLLRVEDDYGYSDMIVNFTVLPVNDEPLIVSHSYTASPRFIEGRSSLFEVEVEDVDGDDLDLYWILDGEHVGFGDDYSFVGDMGSYELEVRVSDGEYNDSFIWDIYVGEMGEFTCSEAGGYAFDNETRVCNGELLGVSDGYCCSIASTERPPEFNDAKTCGDLDLDLSSYLDLDIRNPDSGDEFFPGDSIDVEVRVDNDYDENLNLELDVYFYDITEDDSVSREDANFRVGDGSSRDTSFVFDIDEDIDAGNDYVVFVRVVDEDEIYCVEDYVSIDLEREDDDIRIDKFRILDEGLTCGDYFTLEASLKNFGNDAQDDVVFTVKNTELGILEETEEFELEEFGEDDDFREKFDLMIPDDANEGTYRIDGTVTYGGERVSGFVELKIEECRDFVVDDSLNRPVVLGEDLSEVAQENDGGFEFSLPALLIAIALLLVIVLIVFLIL